MTHILSFPTAVPLEECELLRHSQARRLLLDAAGGSLRRQQMLAQHLPTVLDVACSTGIWAFDTATRYPFLHITGIDRHAPSITYAQRRAEEQGQHQVQFLVQDLRTLDTGPFAPASFDCIHVAFLAPLLLEIDFAVLMQSLLRLCRPGGLLRWTEMELPLTNSLAFEQFIALIYRALDAAGQTFIPSDMQRSAAIFDDWRRSRGVQVTPFERRHLGLTPMMSGWLRHAGCDEVEAFPVPLEVSAGTPAHATFVQQVAVCGHQLAPWLCQHGGTTNEALARLLTQVMEEIQREDFCGLCWLLTLHGYPAM